MLQICQPASFVSNSLSIPFPKDCRQVFLDCHLLSVAAVAVCEDPVWVSLGQRLWAVLQGFPPAARQREGETRGTSHYHHSDAFTSTWPPCVCSLWCWGEEPGHLRREDDQIFISDQNKAPCRALETQSGCSFWSIRSDFAEIVDMKNDLTKALSHILPLFNF